MNKNFKRYGRKAPEDRTETEGRQLLWRSGGLLLVFAAVLCFYGSVLYNLQIVNGDRYQEQASYTTAERETVDSVRGEILDSRGRVLVTNASSYQVTLDTSVMGSAAERNEILLRLIALCREEGVTWTDTFPVTTSAPYTFTKTDVYTYLNTKTAEDEAGNETEVTEERRTNLGALAVKYKWIDDPLAEQPKDNAVSYREPEELMAKMCETFGLAAKGKGAEVELTEDVRALLGVLYELYLRRQDVVYTDYVFAKNVDITFISKVKERGLTGVSVDSVASRKYNTSYAAHVLGQVGAIDADSWPDYKELGYDMDAYVGKTGAERAFESYLRGKSGVREYTTSDSGKIISQSWAVDEETGETLEPVPGGNVTLTLDINFQAVVENALAEHVQSLENPKGAACAVVDMTGGVLALANYPTYDLTRLSEPGYTDMLNENEYSPWMNRATSGLYAPGSTFKLVTAVTGLMEGVIRPRDTFYCGGRYTVEGWRNFLTYCHKRSGHGTENLVKAIKDSCNVYFWEVARRVGIDKLDEYAAQFGLGQSTGIEIGDKAGYVAGPETSKKLGTDWQIGSVTAAAIGQENNQLTPLQIANYIATLVNGGDHYAVHLLKNVKSSDYGTVLYEKEPELLNSIDIPDGYLAAIKGGMYEVSQNAAIARYFNNLPVKVGAKTGTAELTEGAENKNTNGLLVVFAPYEDPQIAMCIVMEGGTSGSSLASLAYDILDYYFSGDVGVTAVSGENTLIR